MNQDNSSINTFLNFDNGSSFKSQQLSKSEDKYNYYDNFNKSDETKDMLRTIDKNTGFSNIKDDTLQEGFK